ncbi:hypothetical protein AAG747_04565 [Rapidithrix thailandica]|uniref:Uncharacterized protein n=1 Tax=Rapidithrix thailandica TaxID=413964 RepID=A0AAW9RQJ8_9BACT
MINNRLKMNDDAWITLLKEVSNKVKMEVYVFDRARAKAWPSENQDLKRPHFEDIHVCLDGFKSSFPKKIKNVPGVETIERCFRFPEKRREKATKDCLAMYAGYSSWEAYRRKYLEIKPVKIHLSLAQSTVHMEFQGRIRELQKQIPHTISNKEFETDDEIVLRYITLYFFLVFDEFHVCQVISPEELGVLWTEFYAKGVLNALERPAFRKRILEMFEEEDNYAFFGLKDEFKNEICRLYREEYGRDLCSEET